MSSKFQYLPLPPEQLPGIAFENQTAAVINELADKIAGIGDDPRIADALALSEQALSEATQAVEIANSVLTVAEQANANSLEAIRIVNTEQDSIIVVSQEVAKIKNEMSNITDVALTAKSVSEATQQIANTAQQTAQDASAVANSVQKIAQDANTAANNAVSVVQQTQSSLNDLTGYLVVTAVNLNNYDTSTSLYINDIVSLNLPVASKGFLTVRSNSNSSKAYQEYFTDDKAAYYRVGDIVKNIVTWGAWSSSGNADNPPVLPPVPFGAKIECISLVEDVVLGSGQFVTTKMQIPHGAVVLSVNGRVLNSITGVTSYNVGVQGTEGMWGIEFSTTAGYMFRGTTYSPIGFSYGPTSIKITSNDNPFSGGTLRLALYYMICSVPEA